MRLKDRIESLHTFDFYDNRVINYQVETIFPDGLSLINDWKYRLADVVQAGIVQFNAKRCFISSFQETRTELAMNLDSASDYSLGKLFKRSTIFDGWRACAFLWSQNVSKAR